VVDHALMSEKVKDLGIEIEWTEEWIGEVIEEWIEEQIEEQIEEWIGEWIEDEIQIVVVIERSFLLIGFVGVVNSSILQKEQIVKTVVN